MNITEVRVKLTEEKKNRLHAFCSITIDDDFVVRDLKIIEGYKGVFVAMPSRKLTDRCPKCGCKNNLHAQFCNDCGAKLEDKRVVMESRGKYKLYADTAHPINSKCRDDIEQKVLAAYEDEVKKAGEPGYKYTKTDDTDIGGYEGENDRTERSRIGEEHP